MKRKKAKLLKRKSRKTNKSRRKTSLKTSERIALEVEKFREYMQQRLDQRDAFINVLVNSLRDTSPNQYANKLDEVLKVVRQIKVK